MRQSLEPRAHMREIMRQLGLGILLALLALAPGTAHANNYTVQDLLQMCNSPEGSQDFVYCVGYIGGLGDTLAMNGATLPSLPQRDANLIRGISICGNISLEAAIQAFKNWAQAHPERWTEPAPPEVALALVQSWPCRL